MLDPDIEERANELKRLDYDQMQFLERRLGIPLELLVDLFGQDRIGVTDNFLVVAVASVEEMLPFGIAGLHNWKAEVGFDGLIHFRVPLDEVRAAA
jgi:hypothetical protein